MNNQLTIDELRAYQAGHLDGPARHRVERLLLEDPFYADALEGLEALQQAGASLPKQTAKLRLALQERIHESATERRLFPLWVTSLAASIVLVLGVAFYVIYTNDPARKQLTQTPKASVTEPIEIDMGDQHPSNIKRAVDAVAVIQQTVNREGKEPEKVTQLLAPTPREQAVREPVATPSASTEDTALPEVPVLEEPVANLRQILHPERAFGPNAPDAPEVLAANSPVIASGFAAPARKAAMSYAMPDAANVPKNELITGLITDNQGVPLPGVSVTIKGTNRGTSTDGVGQFSLDVKDVDGRDLTASFIGYKSVEFPATILAKGAIKLEENTQALAEVVVSTRREAPRKKLRVGNTFRSSNPVLDLTCTLTSTWNPFTPKVEGFVSNLAGVPQRDILIRVIKGFDQQTKSDSLGRFTLNSILAERKCLSITITDSRTVEIAFGDSATDQHLDSLTTFPTAGQVIFHSPVANAATGLSDELLQKYKELEQYASSVGGLNLKELGLFRAYLNQHVSSTFKGPMSVRFRTNADGSIRRVTIENGVLVQESGEEKPIRRFPPSPELRAEAERLVRQYPNWPKKRQWLLWIVNW